MDFARTVQREDRRRRVLREDLSTRPLRREKSSDSRRVDPIHVKPYTDAARADLQPRVTDLIPCRGWSAAVFFLTGLMVIEGIAVLFACGTTWWHWADRATARGLHLVGTGNIASWFSSLALAFTAVCCVLVYNIRRHKADDYRGRYSLWLWAAAGCVLASIDATAGLHRPLQTALVELTGTTLVGTGSIWWIACWFVTFGLIGLRVMLDMRISRAASLVLVMASFLYGATTFFHLRLLWLIDDAVTELVHGSALMLGHWMLTFSVLLYARHIFRVAQGELPASCQAPVKGTRRWRLFRREAKRRNDAAPQRDATSVTSSGTGKTESTESPTVTKQANAMAGGAADSASDAQPSTTSTTGVPPKGPKGDLASAEPPESEESAKLNTSKLSKAERRRLRKQLRRQRRVA